MPLGNVIGSIDSTPTTASGITMIVRWGATNSAASLNAQALPALELAFESECFLAFFSKLALSTAGQKMCVRVVMLDLLNITEEAFNLVPSTVEIVSELGVHLIAAIDLGLEILDSAINITKRALLGTMLALLIFQMSFELKKRAYVSMKNFKLRLGYLQLPP
jgi:hypothetical protein